MAPGWRVGVASAAWLLLAAVASAAAQMAGSPARRLQAEAGDDVRDAAVAAPRDRLRPESR